MVFGHPAGAMDPVEMCPRFRIVRAQIPNHRCGSRKLRCRRLNIRIARSSAVNRIPCALVERTQVVAGELPVSGRLFNEVTRRHCHDVPGSRGHCCLWSHAIAGGHDQFKWLKTVRRRWINCPLEHQLGKWAELRMPVWARRMRRAAIKYDEPSLLVASGSNLRLG